MHIEKTLRRGFLICRPFGFVLLLMICVSTSRSQPNTFPSSGNVGIGTPTPGSKLEVAGDIRVTQGGSVYFDALGRLYSDTSYSILTDPDGKPRIYFAKGAGDAGNSYYDLGDNASAVHHFRNRLGLADLMVIKNNGNVGIGTATPAAIQTERRRLPTLTTRP